MVSLAFRFFLGRGRNRVIVQNVDDRAFFLDRIGIDPDRVVLIQGSGVDTSEFRPVEPATTDKVRVCLVARMIWEKGVRELVAAARVMRKTRDDIEFILVGDSDSESPSGVPVESLKSWHEEGVITWLGHVDNVPALLNGCHLALLPTYREGFPKSLLEAASCGLPIIATDVTGCLEICRDEVNGLLIPPRDVDAIVAAVTRLADDPALRTRFGRESRRLVEQHFSEEIVVNQTMEIYRTMQQELGVQ